MVAIAGLAATTIDATIVRQQRFYRGVSELRAVREGVRDAMEVLSTDLRGMSVADSVRMRADSAIEFFAAVGVSVVCQSAGSEVGLAPVHASGNSLSAFVVEPDTGDLALVYANSSEAGGRWEQYRIADFAPRPLASSCPPLSGFSTQADLDTGAKGFSLTLATSLREDIKVGAPVRFARRARYSLYRASDGASYLGYRRCDAIGVSVCSGIQPVTGPYRSYSSDTRTTGLLFEYFDSAGRRLDPTASPLALSRVDLTARSESAQRASWLGQPSRIADSATVSVAVRNRGQQ